MKVLMVPFLALGMVAGSYSDEPGEGEMRAAFASRLAVEMQAAIDFVAETGGLEAVEKVRAAGTDRYEIKSFRKLDCMRSTELPGHVCGFAVEIGVVNGDLQRSLTGHFAPGPRGLTFRHDA